MSQESFGCRERLEAKRIGLRGFDDHDSILYGKIKIPLFCDGTAKSPRIAPHPNPLPAGEGNFSCHRMSFCDGIILFGICYHFNEVKMMSKNNRTNQNPTRRDFLGTIAAVAASMAAPAVITPSKASAELWEIIPGVPLSVYGDVYNVIDGSPMKGWAKRFGKVVELENGHFDFGEEIEYDQLAWDPLVIRTKEGYFNVSTRCASAASSPLRFDVSPMDPDHPFYHNPVHTGDMFPSHAKWKRPLPIPIWLNRPDATAGEIATLESAIEEWNELYSPKVRAINDYIRENNIDRELHPEALFIESDYQLSSAKAAVGKVEHQGINVKWNGRLTQSDLSMSQSGYDAFIYYGLVHLTAIPENNPKDTTTDHELGHSLNAEHTHHVNSVMSPTTGHIKDDDVKSVALIYTAPFDARIQDLTDEPVDVEIPSPVSGWRLY